LAQVLVPVLAWELAVAVVLVLVPVLGLEPGLERAPRSQASPLK